MSEHEAEQGVSDPMQDPTAEPVADPAAPPVQEPPTPEPLSPEPPTSEALSPEALGAAGDGEEGPETLAVPVAVLRPALEAVLMVADQPLDQVTLASAVGYPVDEVGRALTGLAEEYAEQGRGFDLRNVAGGWRFYTREEYAPVVEKFVLDGQQARLTQAALETLAVVAYKQPVSRARVSAVRGVNVDGVMRTLLARGLVEECGHDEETGALLYRTTSYFLERIGVTSIDELPELAPYLPEISELDDLAESANAVRGATAPSANANANADADADAGTPDAQDEPGAGVPEAAGATAGVEPGEAAEHPEQQDTHTAIAFEGEGEQP